MEREKIREYAVAVKNDDPPYHDERCGRHSATTVCSAPLTFISVFGYRAQSAFFANANIGISGCPDRPGRPGIEVLAPIQVGDKLYCDVYVHSVRQAHGTDIIVTKNIITNQAGELVQETYTTLARA